MHIEMNISFWIAINVIVVLMIYLHFCKYFLLHYHYATINLTLGKILCYKTSTWDFLVINISIWINEKTCFYKITFLFICL